MKKTINSYDFMQDKLVTINWDNYCKDIIVLNHHYMGDVMILDKVRENAKKLGYKYERNLNTIEVENISPFKLPSHYEKLTVFTKIDTEKSDEFPKEKIAIYRAYSYRAEFINTRYKSNEIYRAMRYFGNLDGDVVELYNDFVRLFCGAEGFEYNRINSFIPINTILILVLDDVYDVPEHFFPLRHKNFILFCLISTSSPHEIFIAPDLRANKDSDYQKKIDELKFLLGIDEKETNE